MELRTLKDTQSFSKKISNILKKGDIIFLYGEIGVGKTTFVRFLINNLHRLADLLMKYMIQKYLIN